MIDVDHQISRADRRVGRRTLPAGEARVLTISRAYGTPPEDLWDACTDPDRLRRWFLPVSGDLREGGTYQLEGNASGTIERCEPPAALAATWEYGGQVSWIELRISGEGEGRSRFTLEHLAHVEDEIWSRFGPGAVGVGWDQAVLGLSLYLAGGADLPERDAVEAWQLSPEGLAFTRQASDGWGEAAVAAGAEPEAARAAAARTTAFYSGQEPVG